MAQDSPQQVDRRVYADWLRSLQRRDPELFADLSARFAGMMVSASATTLEATAEGVAPTITPETIVRLGRPALLTRDYRVVSPDAAVIEDAARVVIGRLEQARGVVEPMISLVGRIDVANFAGSLTFVGTAWLVDRDLVVTNRHVAELISRSEAGAFRFRPGRFGESLIVTLDYRHESGVTAAETVRVEGVLWIEPDAKKADIAFLTIGTGSVAAGRPPFIPLADADAAPDTDVAVVGYPARAPSHIIPDQEWMDRIYGGIYDVKRIAPGKSGPRSRGWATHDCTTLGGNSGSVVLDLATGKAVALHFAGLYMIENYAVPASVVRRYLQDRPWHPDSRPRPQPPDTAGVLPPAEKPVAMPVPVTSATSVSYTIPLTLTVTLGTPQAGRTTVSTTVDAGSPQEQVTSIDDAARALRREHRHPAAVDAWPGYLIRGGQLTDDQCLVVSAAPDAESEVRAAMPAQYAGFPVDVRPASITEQIGQDPAQEAATSIEYNDDDRTGPGFSFAWVEEPMELLLHVGPERSWTVLRQFLAAGEQRLVSSMYEFHAKHIARTLQERLIGGAALKLVLGGQSRDHQGDPHEGDFDRSQTFARWAEQYPDKFQNIFVPTGSQGLVANAYHIKVTVRDDLDVWLSSGNWKRSSQPVIPDDKLNDPKATGRAGNREWHVVATSDTLAARFKNHIEEDFRHSGELGGTPEAVGTDVLIDVPVTVQESIELEGAPSRVLEVLRIAKRSVRVKPLLTPDQRGAVYCRAVLQLIRSATRQLLFQIPYINMRGAESGFLKQLVDAMVDRSKDIDDFRLILRSPVNELQYNMSQLKRRGLDVASCVRTLANTHTKGMVVDGVKALVGSHNWSAAGVTLNRDASLIFDDAQVAQYYAEAFELDWVRARELSFDERPVTEAPRPAVGDRPPAGFVRMTLAEYLEG